MQPQLCLKIWRVVLRNVLYWIFPKQHYIQDQKWIALPHFLQHYFSASLYTGCMIWNICILYRLPFHSVTLSRLVFWSNYAEQKYKRNMLVPYFMSWYWRSHKFSICTKSLFCLHFVHKFVYIPVSEHFSFAKMIHPPDRCGISRSWLNSMITTQVHLVLGTIKSHSKMCSFVTQHNATDVWSFEGACNGHADYRNAYQRIECPFLYHKPLPT